MNSRASKRTYLPATEEKKSARILIEKMGLAKKELDEINAQYGVSSSQLVELMQYYKFRFVNAETPKNSDSYPS
jgi:hypothetical protein